MSEKKPDADLLDNFADFADEIAKHHDHDGQPCLTGDLATGLSHAARKRSAEMRGPAQVATERYRKGWEGVFGAKPVRGQA